jgi:macrolide transport system ATP-binding/permease protein
VVRTLLAVDYRVVVDDPQMLEALLADTVAQRTRTMRVLALAALVVLLLTAFSVSGALRELVASKTAELALRQALGARRRDTVLVLARCVAGPGAAGLFIGAGGGWVLAGTMASELVGVAPADPAMLMAAVVTVLVVGSASAIGQLSRALAIDPGHELRAL